MTIDGTKVNDQSSAVAHAEKYGQKTRAIKFI